MSSEQFYKLSDAALKDAIGDAGFKRKGPGLWNRRSGDELNVIRLQRYRGDERYCVNMGIHYAFLPTPGTGATSSEKRFDEAHCEIRKRLTPDERTNDYWWPGTEESAAEIGLLAERRGLPIFDAYRLDGPIVAMSTREVEGAPGLLSGMAKARACLLLARLHEHLGNRDRASEAATRGIELAEPHATLAVASLKEVLRRSQAAQ